MKTPDRLLALFAGGIGLLALLALLLVLNVGNKPVVLLPEETPQGVVQRYLMAIGSGDYLLAFNYLSLPPDGTTTYDIWRKSINFQANRPAYKATLGQSRVSGNDAEVDMVIDVFRNGGGLFNNAVNSNSIAFVLKIINGTWKITSPTDVWWIY
jgi:hypothetical protein